MTKPSTAPHRGETVLRLDGRDYRLVFDYDAIDRLIGAFGAEWEAGVRDALLHMTPGALCSIAAIGLQRHHFELTEVRLRELSPPLVPLASAIAKAIRLATLGPEEPTQGKAEGTQEAPGMSLLTPFRKLLALRSAWASSQANSGGSPPTS